MAPRPRTFVYKPRPVVTAPASPREVHKRIREIAREMQQKGAKFDPSKHATALVAAARQMTGGGRK